MPRLLLLPALALLLVLSAVGPARAVSKEDAVRAGQIQSSARDAYEKGDLEEALRLAGRAISIEDGPTTWLAQQIRIEVLEKQGHVGQAMEHLRSYLALDGLFPEHRAWGEEAEQRLSRRIEAAKAKRRQAALAQRGAGVGLMVGGAVPLGLGVGFLANYGSKASDPLFGGGSYDGFLDAGIAFLAVGATLEVVGVIVAASAPSLDPVAGRRSPRFVAAPILVGGPNRVVFGLGGRF